MIKSNDNLHNILLDLEVVNNIPVNVKNHFEKNKQKNLKKVLKKTKMYSFWSSLIISFMFFLKKIGISLTYLQSIIVFITLVNFTSATIIFSGVVAYKNYSSQNHTAIVNKQAPIKKNLIKNQHVKQGNLKKRTNVPVEKIISIQPFDAIKVKKRHSKKIANSIYAHLSKFYGNDKVTIRKKGEKIHKAGMLIMGTVELDNETNEYIIDVSLVEVKNNVVIIGLSETINKLPQIDTVCKQISKKINNELN